VPARVRCDQRHFRICGGCQRVYWRGSHYERLTQLLQELLDSVTSD